MTYTVEQYEEFAKHMEDTFPKMFAHLYGGFAIGVGWWPVVEKLCHSIQDHINFINGRRELLLQDNPHNLTIPDEVVQVTVDQIKEKFGGLRFYYTGGDGYIDGLVAMAERWAGAVCEECGKPARRISVGGWLSNLCEEHERERNDKIQRT